MKKTKFLKLASITSIVMAATLFQNAQAAQNQSQDDDSVNMNNQACLVAVETPDAYRLINVSYIRLLQITADKNDTVQIYMASNLYAYGDTDKFKIKYANPTDAKKGLVELGEKINFCRENLPSRNKTATLKK